MMHLAIALFLLAAQQVPQPVDASDLAIKGVQVGMARSEVITKLGKPRRTVKGYDEEMGTGHWEELRYPGLLVEVIQPVHGMLKNPPREPYVSRVVLSGGRWATANGVKLGMSPQETRRILGEPESTEAKSQQVSHWYPTARFDGRVVLRFRNDKLVELTIEEDWT